MSTVVHRRFIYRQVLSTRQQGGILLLCVALVVVACLTIGSLRHSIQDALLNNTKQLHAADIMVTSSSAFAPETVAALTALQHQGQAELARVYSFYAMVRQLNSADEASLLASLKVVETGYPFYGRIELASGRDFREVLTPGNIIVEPRLLERLGLRVGDRVSIGKALLTIRDVVLWEPDRPVEFFSLGPRVFVALADLPALDLVQKGSRVRYTYLLKIAEHSAVDRVADALQQAVSPYERVTTFQTAESGVKTFFDKFLFFLNLTTVYTLLLAGIGIQSTLRALTRSSEATIATLKTVGATSGFIIKHFMLMICLLGALGTLLGLALGSLGLPAVAWLFRGLLPPAAIPSLSWPAILESTMIGSLILALFAFLPLYRLRDVKPNLIFRQADLPKSGGFLTVLVYTIIGLFFAGMILWRMPDLTTGLAVTGGSLALIGLVMLAAYGVLWTMRHVYIHPLALRLAVQGFWRPGNATRAMIITLTVSLAVLFSLYLVELNLHAKFIQAYPDDAPNVFLLDIQPPQREPIKAILGETPLFYPVVRARIRSIQGRPLDREAERQRSGDNLAREFSLTYRHELLADEAMSEGATLFRKDWDEPQVSVLDTVADMHPMDIGDYITFSIQGIPLRARISSFRTRTQETLQPFFYFVFPEQVLGPAPQTIFTAVRVEPARISRLQSEIVSQFPNVSVIDVTKTLTAFAQVMHRLSVIIRFFTGFSLIAGMCIVISSIVATRAARIREAVYFKILGATRRFVRHVFALESAIISAISALLALFLSQIGSWILARHVLDIDYQPFIGTSCLLLAASVTLVTAVGSLASRSILQHKPALFLREHAED
jgi:putative ABC transport system permease protein